VRKTVCEGLYWDLDFVNCYHRPWPALTSETTKRAELKKCCKKLLRMCEEEDEDQGMYSYHVTYQFKYAQLGREYAVGGGNATLQSLSGTVRKTVCEDLYWDLDFVNCFNVILLAAARRWEWPDDVTALLDKIVNNRSTVHTELIDYYGCSEGAAKVLIIKHWGGGKAKAWMRDKKNKISDAVKAKVSDEGHHRIVIELERVGPIVLRLFLEEMPEMKAMVDDVNMQRARDGKDAKNDYTALTAPLKTQLPEDFLAGMSVLAALHPESFLAGMGGSCKNRRPSHRQRTTHNSQHRCAAPATTSICLPRARRCHTPLG
jgi:hypothetical protein